MLDYLNKAFPEKKESYRLANLLNIAILSNFDTDPLWREIIANAAETNRLRNYPEYCDLQPEAPFAQGDKPNDSNRLPDVIYLGEDFVIGIECFDFDSSKKTKDGSTMRKQNKKAGNRLNELMHETKPPSKVSVEVDANLSYSNYVDSLLNAFRKHAEKTEIYRKALEKEYPEKKQYLAFFAEDVTQIGNYIKSDGKMVSMNPIFVKEFVTELLTQNGIDYIIACYQELYVPHIFLQKVDTILLTERLKQCYEETDSFLRYQYALQTTAH